VAIKFQYNKTALQLIQKQLKIRLRALPTLKNKESALRVEVQKAKNKVKELENKLDELKKHYQYMVELWAEFDTELIKIKKVEFDKKKIAGVNTPILNHIDFEIKDFSYINRPAWFMDGIKILKELLKIAIEKDFFYRKMEILNHARKKTTQKVNLYEKVQIPEFENAVRKIKRFLEDEENLAKSAQKIVKNRQQKEAEIW
jgi:V/A-type H+-transporting ATPase subunit D